MVSLYDSTGHSQFGSGYGLLADVAAAASFFGLAYLPVHNFLDLSSFNMKKSIDLDLRNRLISFLHGLIAIALSTQVVFFYWQECGADTQ